MFEAHLYMKKNINKKYECIYNHFTPNLTTGPFVFIAK